ncbi:fibronectin type III domain-containing protein [Paenibacillus sp. FSL R5-0473]|uniref:fibronectin type III domain-containing protein n=1 Tax=Paenibacillus sp. FSL R5-0473 TaxID=2921642 RepID=UPI0030FA3B20
MKKRRKVREAAQKATKVVLALALLAPPLVATGVFTPAAYAAVDTISVVSNTTSLKAVQSSVVKVEMNDQGNYRIILLPNTNVFYGSNAGNVSTFLDYNGERINFNSLPLNYFRINDNIIEMSRQKDNVEFILRVSIVNATSQGGYMKVELEAVNRGSGNQNLGGTFYWDTMVNGNDASPFEVIQNGWRNYSGGVQITAFYANTYNVVNADRIFMGAYQSPGNASLTGGSPPSSFYVGQQITAGDTAAQFWWDKQTVSSGGSRKVSTIVGIGPQNTPPSFALSSPAANQSYYKGQTLQIAGTTKDTDIGDLLTVKWSIDGGAENVLSTLTANGSNQQFSSNYTLPSTLSDGAHSLQVWVMDDKGGVSTANTVNFTIRSFVVPGQPVISSTSTNGLTVTWDKKENESAVTYELLNVTTNQTINAGSANTATVTGLSPNTNYVFKVRAKNSSGSYTDYSTQTSSYTYANTPTSATVTQTGNSPTVKWSANGNPTGTTYKYELRDADSKVVKSGTTTATTLNIPLDGVADGKYNVFVSAVNGGGIATAYTAAGQIIKDTKAPTAPEVSVAPSSWTNTSAIVTVKNGTDDLSGVQKSQYKVGSTGEWVDYKEPFEVSKEGLQDIYARTIDNFGNTSIVSSSTARIDKTAPEAPIFSLDPSSWTNKDVNVTLSPGTDNLSGVQKIQYKIGPGGEWKDYTKGFSITTEGRSEIYGRSIDNASNISVEAVVEAKIDKTGPTAPKLTLSDLEWTNKNVTFTITDGVDEGSGAAKTQYRFGATGAWVDYVAEETISAEGETEIFARTVDNVGNVGALSSALAKIDKTAPSTPQVLLSESSWTQDSVTFSINGSTDHNPIHYEYKINDTEFVKGSTGTIHDNGITTLTVRARDAVGNVGEEVVKKVFIDNLDPSISITPNTTDWTDKNIDVSITYSDVHSGVDPNQRYFKITNSAEAPVSWDSADENEKIVTIDSEGTWYVHAKVQDNAGNSVTTVTSPLRLQRLPDVPEHLKVTNVSEGTAKVSFDLPEDVLTDGYQFEIENTTTGQTWSLDYPSNEILDEALSGGNRYEYRVRAMNHVGHSDFSSTVSTLTLPLAPENVVIQKVGTDYSQASVSFDPVTSASSYRIIARDRNNQIVSDQIVHGTSAQLISGLSAGTVYSVSVIAINESGEGSSRNAGFLSLPSAPGHFASVQIEETKITLGWDTVTSATYYSLNRDGESLFEGPELTFTDSGLESGTLYQYGLSASNETGTGETVTLNGLMTLPGKIQGLQIVNPTQHSLGLTWQAVQGADHYVIVQEGREYLTVPSEQTTAVVQDLAPGTSYSFEVFAVNESGQGSSVSASSITVPDQVQELKLDSITETSATVSWLPVPGADRYRLKIGDRSFEVAGTHLELTGLSGSNVYNYTVEAGNNSGYSDSVGGEFLTNPHSPNQVEVTETTETTISLRWETVATANSYIVSMDGQIVATPTSAEFEVNDLIPGSKHTFTVQAVNQTGESQKTAYVWMTKPSFVTNVQSSPATYKAEVNWEPVTGAIEYIIEHDDNVLYQGTETSLEITGLSDGTNYDYVIHAVNEFGVSSQNSKFGFKTLPRKPVNVNTVDIEKESLTLDLSDTQVTGADTYVIKRNGVLIAKIPSSDIRYTDKGLLPGTKYSYSIHGENTSGAGEVRTVQVTTKTEVVNENSIVVHPETNQINVTWSPVKGAVSYQILNNETGDKYSTSNLESIIPSLSAGSIYSFTITSFNVEGIESEPLTFTSLTKPTAPSTATISGITDTSLTIDLSMSAVRGAEEYIIERDGKEVGRIPLNETSFKEDGLEAGEEYTYVIKTSNKSGESVTGFALTARTVPATSSKLAEVLSVSDNSVSISWDKIQGAEGYKVYFDSELITITTEFSASVDNLISAQTYNNIRVVPFNNAGDAIAFSVKEFTTLPVIKGLIVNSKPKTTEAELSWTLPLKNEIMVIEYQGEEVYRGQETNFTLTELRAGTNEEVTFITENSQGDRSEEFTHSLLTLPAAPPTVSYTSTSNGVSLDFALSQVKGATAYIVQRGGEEIGQVTVTESVYNDENLEPGKTYKYFIRTLNDTGISEEGFALDATTLPADMTISPSIDKRDVDGVEISWEPVIGATGYNLYDDDTIITSTENTSFSLTGLRSSTKYGTYRIVPFNEVGEAKGIDVPIFETLPSGDFEVKAVGKTTNEVDFTWTLPSANEIFVLAHHGTEVYRGKDQHFTLKNLSGGTVYLMEAWTENENSDRSEVKEITARTLGFLAPSGGNFSGQPVSKPTESIKDVPADLEVVPTPPVKQVFFEDIDSTFNKEQIIFLAQQGVISGISETKFEPQRAITRAEFTALIVRLMGIESAEYKGTFKDVSPEDWFAEYIAAGIKNKVIAGMGNQVFAPHELITREQASVILANVLRGMNASGTSEQQRFVDETKISGWAADKVNYLSELGLVNGYQDGSFRPLKDLTRSEAAALIFRLMEVVHKDLENNNKKSQ